MEIPEDVRACLPLTETTYFMLLSLLPQPRHGYAIMKAVQDLSENRVALSTGTLYGAIKRLLEQGWIERVEEPNGGPVNRAENGRERKAYALTHLGRRVLEMETARLQALVRVAGQMAALEASLRRFGEQP